MREIEIRELGNPKPKEIVVSPSAYTPAQKIIREAKTKVCAELEKVCPTEKSLNRMVKEMHNIFDKLDEDIATALNQ